MKAKTFFVTAVTTTHRSAVRAILIAASLTSSVAGAQVFELRPHAPTFDGLAPTWEGAAFEETFSPSSDPAHTGCLSSVGAVSMPLDGGWLTIESESLGCPITDGTSSAATADGVIEEGDTLRLTFDPPIRALYTYGTSLASSEQLTMRVLSADGKVDHVMQGSESTDPVAAQPLGFIAARPIAVVEFSSSEAGTTLIGRFASQIGPGGAIEVVRPEACGVFLCDFAYAYETEVAAGVIYDWEFLTGASSPKVVADDQVLVASSPQASTPGAEGDGAIKLYGRNVGGTDNWGALKVIGPPATSGSLPNFFGAVLALDGDTLAVGAPLYGGPSPASPERGPGAVFIFERDLFGEDAWGLRQTILAPDEWTLSFGSSIAIDGRRLVVGAPFKFHGLDIAAGSVFVFEKPGTALFWSPAQELKAPVTSAGANFGTSVDVDGSKILVGAPDERKGSSVPNPCEPNLVGTKTGAVYLFEQSAGSWSCADRYFSPCTTSCDTGASVAVDGDTVIFGSPGYDYRGTLSVINQNGIDVGFDGFEPDIGSRFGHELALSGSRLLVGSYFRSGQLFELRDRRWKHVSRLGGRAVSLQDGVLATLAEPAIFVEAPLFTDGFESGGTEEWSHGVP